MFHASEWIASLIDRELDAKDLDIAFEKVGGSDKSQRIQSIQVIHKFSKHPKEFLPTIAKHIPALIKLAIDFKERVEVVCDVINIFDNVLGEVDQDYESITIPLLMDLMNLYPKELEYQAIQILHRLSRKRLKSVCRELLQLPNAIRHFVDGLASMVPYIRNETILLLGKITLENQEIQKIVAFGSGFTLLLSIIEEEGGANGTEIVKDCLEVINNLLYRNTLLVNLFSDPGSGFIKRIISLLKLDNVSDLWVMDDGKVEIMVLAMKTIEILLSDVNPLDLHKCQCEIGSTGGLDALLLLTLCDVQIPIIKYQAFYTLSLLIRENLEQCNQLRNYTQFRNHTNTKQEDAVSQILYIIRETKSDKIRTNALACIRCYLIGNQEAQSRLVDTPSIKEELLLLKESSSCIILSYILYQNVGTKHLLMGEFDRLLRLLMESIKSESVEEEWVIGLLRMVVIWLHDCVDAVNIVSSNPSNVVFFLQMIEHHANPHISALSALLITLIGSDNHFHMLELILLDHVSIVSVDRFVDKLSHILTMDEFIHPDRYALYDTTFCLFFASFHRIVVVKLVPHSNVASIKWEKIQEVESRHLTEKIRYLEESVQSNQETIKLLEHRLLSDTSPSSSTTNRIDIIQLHQDKLNEKELLIMTLMKRVNSLSDQELLLTQLEELRRENNSLKQKLQKKKNDLSEKNTMVYSNMAVLQNRINVLEEEYKEKCQLFDNLLLLVGENASRLRDYEQRLGINHEEEDDESCSSDSQ